MNSFTPGIGASRSQRWIHFARERAAFFRAAGIALLYVGWVRAAQLLFLSLFTYLVNSSHTRASRFEDINEAYHAHELSLMGLAAIAFVLLLRGLNPLTATTTAEIITPEKIEKKFLPGFMHGSVLAMGVTLAFVLSGAYRYLGFFVQLEETPLAIAGFLFRLGCVVAFAYCEEFIFRQKIERRLWSRPGPFTAATFTNDLAAVIFTAILFAATKVVQFDIGIMQVITLFLLSITLSLRALAHRDFALGAGYWAALLVVFQPILSLPIFGNDFSGLILIKYQGSTNETLRFITGGVGGPASSLAFQVFLTVDVVRGILRYRKYAKHSNGTYRTL